MAGLDWHVPIQLREQLSFPRGRVVELNRLIRDNPGVEGCALLSTCNRTELYLSCAEGTEPDPAALLCAAALALPFCLGAAPESAPGGGGDTVLVDPHIMLPGPDAPTPQPLPITPLPDLDGEGLPEGETPLLPLE